MNDIIVEYGLTSLLDEDNIFLLSNGRVVIRISYNDESTVLVWSRLRPTVDDSVIVSIDKIDNYLSTILSLLGL